VSSIQCWVNNLKFSTAKKGWPSTRKTKPCKRTVRRAEAPAEVVTSPCMVTWRRDLDAIARALNATIGRAGNRQMQARSPLHGVFVP
jgi:hypothetical protein